MRVRIQKMFDHTKCRDILVVQVWKDQETIWRRSFDPGVVGKYEPIPPYWDPVRDFELDEYEKARLYALNASKPLPQSTMVEFDDGVQT